MTPEFDCNQITCNDRLVVRQFDFVVIGGGEAGLAAAGRVARAGRRVAIVDRGAVGGLCSLAGCNPKKVFVHAAEALQRVRDAAEHGIEAAGVRIDWPAVWRRKHRFTDPVTGQTERWLAEL